MPLRTGVRYAVGHFPLENDLGLDAPGASTPGAMIVDESE